MIENIQTPARGGLLRWLPPAWAAWIYTVILKPAPVRALAQKVICLFIPDQLRIGGVDLALNRDDAIVSGNLALGCYETYNLAVFENMLRPGFCVVDVGANIGLYSAIGAKRVGPSGRVVAVEPDATNCSFIRLTRERNHLDNLVVIEKAAGAVSGPALLHLCRTNKADHRSYGDGQRETVAIEMTTLDSLYSELQLPPVDILKVDTQGFELFVARGMEQMLETSPDVNVLIEFWPWGITKAGGSPKELLEFFTDRGFTIWEIDDYRKELRRLDTFDSILELTLERQHANLYMKREGAH